MIKFLIIISLTSLLFLPNLAAALTGDLNNDNIVNSLDWSVMNSKWFSNDTKTDLNADGIVNAIDFSILNSNWFKISTNSGSPSIAGCQIFPIDNPWNKDISNESVHPNSENYINSIGKTKYLHADFGGNGQYGIPYVVVDAGQPKITINFTTYGAESDPGPYPIPSNAPVEGGPGSTGDRHVLVLDSSTCTLYELFRAFYRTGHWDADSGAIFNLNSNTLRPDYWTSTDAAGLPVLPGLIRYDEVAAGEIKHAIRFTIINSQRGFIHPATHYASSNTDPNLPPMGLRLRLKASYDISRFTGQSKVILQALKKYGLIVADNGSDWFITGATDIRWNDDDLNQLKSVPGSAFETMRSGPIIK